MGLFGKKPSLGFDTAVDKVCLTDGLQCIAHNNGQEYRVDMPVEIGGEHSAPTPGFYGRVALASCIAIGIKLTAARRDIAIAQISVVVEMDFDDRGIFGLDSVSAGCSALRIGVEVQSDADHSVVRAVIDEGMLNDPWLLVFSEAQNIQTTISIEGAA